MKNCLIEKLKSEVNNSDLRLINEIRFTATASGTGENPVNLKHSCIASAGQLVEYEVISGNAYFMNTAHTVNYNTYVKSADDIHLFVSSGVAEISIKNFDLFASMLGYGTGNYIFPIKLFNENAPLCVFDADEFSKSYHPQLTEINAPISGNIKPIRNIESLESIKFSNQAGLTVSGNLADFIGADGLKTMVFGSTLSSEMAGFTEFNWSFEDLGQTNIKAFYANCTHCLGGDLYELFKRKSELDIVATRCNAQGVPSIVCSYTSGQTIPTVSITNINLYITGRIDKTNVTNFMNLLKDGANASKISVSGEINLYVAYGVNNDPDVVALKTELSGLGITVNLYS